MLYNDFWRLMALGFPGGSSSSEQGQIIARDYFHSALDCRELELRIRDHDPADLDSAFKFAFRAETYLRASDEDKVVPRDKGSRRDRYDENRARVVFKAPAASESSQVSDKNEPVIKLLQQQLKRADANKMR